MHILYLLSFKSFHQKSFIRFKFNPFHTYSHSTIFLLLTFYISTNYISNLFGNKKGTKRTRTNMCMASVSVSTAEKVSIFSRLQSMFHLKRKEEEKKITTTKTTPISTTTDRHSTSSSGSDNNSELGRVFMYFDEDGDGKVSPAELRRCMKAVGGELTAEEAEMAVRLSDSDGDGLLGLEDFTKLMEEERNKESELIGAFEMYEMEGSGGYITPKSLKRMLSRLGESTSIDKCKAMIRRFDINGDGVLSFDEFKIMMTN